MGELVALLIVVALVSVTGAFALLGVRRSSQSVSELLIGGRSFGRWFIWILMAGENYTSYTFLGAAGWAYGKGICAFYVFCSFTIACIISYFILPPMWRRANRNGSITNADHFLDSYGSNWLGVVVGVIGLAALIPFIALQLEGIHVLIFIASYGNIKSPAAVALPFFLTVGFVYKGGLRTVAWASFVKNGMMIVAIGFAGVFLPIHFFGSHSILIDQVLKIQPNWLTLGSGSGLYGVRWFISTICLTSCGAFMWPHVVSAAYSAKSEDTLRWNAVRLPAYQLVLLAVYFAGFSALVLHPGLKGTAIDESFMLVVQRHYSPAALGFVAGAGCLAALVPSATQVLAAASLFSRNIVEPLVGRGTAEMQKARARLFIVATGILVFVFWMVGSSTIIGLVLLAYNIIAQLFPGVVLSLLPKRPSAAAVVAGMSVAYAILISSWVLRQSVWHGINVGLVALVANAFSVVALGYSPSLIAVIKREPRPMAM